MGVLWYTKAVEKKVRAQRSNTDVCLFM